MKKLLTGLAVLSATLVAGSALAVNTYNFAPNPSDLQDLDHFTLYAWEIDSGIGADEVVSAATIRIDNINNWAVEPNYLFIDLLNLSELTATEAGGPVLPDLRPTSTYDGWTAIGSTTVATDGYDSTTWKEANNAVADDGNGTDYFQGKTAAAVASSGGHLRLDTFVDSEGYTSYGGWLVDPTTIDGHVTYNPNSGGYSYEYSLNADQLAILDDWVRTEGGSVSLAFDADCHFWNDGVSFEIQTDSGGGGPLSTVPEPGTMLLLGTGLIGLGGIARRRRS